MNIQQAKDAFKYDSISGFDVVKDPLSSGIKQHWLLAIGLKNGRSDTLTTAKGEVKSFASLDTLYGEIEEIAGRCSSFQVRI